MFRFTRKPSSGSHSQYLAKITGLVQCRYRRRTDVVSVMGAYAAITYISTRNAHHLMLYRELFAVYCKIHTKNINRLCGQCMDYFFLNLVTHTLPH